MIRGEFRLHVLALAVSFFLSKQKSKERSIDLVLRQMVSLSLSHPLRRFP